MDRAAFWKLQGELLGSTIYKEQVMITGATSNPGSVQARIEAAHAKAAAEKEMHKVNPHTIDPVSYAIEYNIALTKALSLIHVG